MNSTFDHTPRGKWIIRKDDHRWVAYKQPTRGEIVKGDGWRLNSMFAPLWLSHSVAVEYMNMRIKNERPTR